MCQHSLCGKVAPPPSLCPMEPGRKHRKTGDTVSFCFPVVGKQPLQSEFMKISSVLFKPFNVQCICQRTRRRKGRRNRGTGTTEAPLSAFSSSGAFVWPQGLLLSVPPAYYPSPLHSSWSPVISICSPYSPLGQAELESKLHS